ILAEHELAAIAGLDRIEVCGPDVVLVAEAVQPMALFLHEMATNAVKHGSLSRPGGRVALAWRTDGVSGRLHLRWSECHGPSVMRPDRAGFGTALMREVVESQLDGTLQIDWRSNGIVSTLVLPSGHLTAATMAPAPAGHRQAY
ncbi:MAG TPA: hypothetical protein VK943_06105, partial [Arenibaculum sp.]|nr:hypothetical protein [Arenibaculum sp.]